VLRRGITELHGIFQQLIGYVTDGTLELGLALSRSTVVTREERYEVISKKISGKTISAPPLLNGDRGRRKADLEMLAAIVFLCNEMAKYPCHGFISSRLAHSALSQWGHCHREHTR
jgi:hypothetical protein